MTVFSPLDLLSIPGNEQDIIRCLVRRPQLTAPEIAQQTEIPLAELEDLLMRMVRNSQLIHQLVDGKNRFDVALAREKQAKRERSKNSLLDSLFQ